MFLKLFMSLITATMIISAAAWPQPVAAQEVTQQEEVASTQSELTNVLLEEMTLVWLQDESYGHIQAACAGNGLNNIQPLDDGPMVLIPNAGDLSLAGSNVSIKLVPNGQITFIPRTQGQLIRVPADIGDKVAGQEVLSLSLAEGLQFIESGHLIWTAANDGPFGNGHGLPGHIASCDPQYDEDVYEDYVEDNEEENDVVTEE